MINSLAKRIANHFFDSKDTYPLEVYIYGIELLISTVISTSFILLAGIVTNSFLESVIFQVCFFVIRIYTGGYHSMTYLRCIILSTLSYILVYLSLLFAGSIFENPFVIGGTYVVTMVLALILAPVKNPNKELTSSDCKKYKLLSLIVITIVFGVCVLCLYIFGIRAMRVIIPTCIVIDAAMLVSVINK